MVLVLALIVMAATFSMGLAFLITSTQHIEAQSTGLDRVRARVLAESALDLGYRKLAEDSTFRGTNTFTVAGEEVSYNIYNDGVDVLIEGTGTSGELSLGMLANAGRGDTQIKLEHTWTAVGDLSFNSSSL